MRIAVAGCRGVPGLYSGFETAATEVGARLAERGHDVSVYCRKGYGDASEQFHRGIRKIYLPQISFKVGETLSHTCVSLLHALIRRPDVLIVMNPANGPLLVIPRLRGIPVALNVDGLEWERSKWSWIGRRYLYFASWVATKTASALIADSRSIQRLYATQWHAESFYASYGADVEESARPEIVQEYGLEPDGYFLVVARLEPENNPHLIVSAFERTHTDKKLVIVGGAAYEGRFQRALRANTRDPRIIFAGPIYDQVRLTELMCQSFAYVHGHMVGGTNPILLKALGCGARILFADVPFNSEVVANAGVPFPLSIEGVRDALQKLVDNPAPANACRSRAHDRIREAYTWDMATDRYEELCRRLSQLQPIHR